MTRRRALHNQPARTKGPLTIRHADGTVTTVPNRRATRIAYDVLDVLDARLEHLRELRQT